MVLTFVGLVLLVVYLIALFKGGTFRGTFKDIEEFTKKLESDELEHLSEKEIERKSLAVIVKLIGITIYSVVVGILLVIFLIGALKVDELVFPTVLILAYVIYGIVLKAVSKKHREKIKLKDATAFNLKDQLVRATMVVYVIYILTQLIWG